MNVAYFEDDDTPADDARYIVRIARAEYERREPFTAITLANTVIMSCVTTSGLQDDFDGPTWRDALNYVDQNWYRWEAKTQRS